MRRRRVRGGEWEEEEAADLVFSVLFVSLSIVITCVLRYSVP